MSVTSHPSADAVYTAVRAKLPSISEGTVYRILNSFTKEGEAQEILPEVSHYNGDTSQHAHFICRKCGTVSDVFDNNPKVKYNRGNDFGEIDGFQLNFYAKCNKCLK